MMRRIAFVALTMVTTAGCPDVPVDALGHDSQPVARFDAISAPSVPASAVLAASANVLTNTDEPTEDPPAASLQRSRPDQSVLDEPPATGLRLMYSGPTDEDRVALTFDDGPSAELTPSILRVLDQYDVQATFFVMGERAEANPELLRSVVAAGHELGNHAFSHRSFRSLWKSQIREELTRTQAAISRATGLAPRFLRPPFGRFAESATPIFAELGFDVVLWSVDSHDWERTPEQIARAVARKAQPGSIILMHDRKPQAVQALPDLIDGLRARGLEPVPVSVLVGLEPYR